MKFSLNDGQGELEVDHRASPGIPEPAARRMGYDPLDVREGAVARMATAFCPHCGSHVILNAERKRKRNMCFKCNSYICDGCAAAMRDPDYTHLTFAELADKVKSGRFTLVGKSMSKLKLIPITGE